MPSYTRVANGNISPCRFVTQDTSNVGKVTQATAGQQVYGISQEGTRRVPGDIGLDDGFCAIAGENLNIYGPPAKDVLLKLGGTVTIGDRLKSDGSGQGVSTTTPADEVGAIALQSGVSGDLVRVQCVNFKY